MHLLSNFFFLAYYYAYTIIYIIYYYIPCTIYYTGDKDWLKINAGQKALVRVSHSTEMTSRLSVALTDQTLPPVDRAALLLDSYALAKAGMYILSV